MNAMQGKLIGEFADAEYAHAYMASHTIDRIAGQVYWTRKKRGWTQNQLADHASMAQERISKIEAGDFSSLTMKTLRKLAEALDVNLRVELEPFSHSIVSVCSQSRSQLELVARNESLQILKQSLGFVQAPYGMSPIIVGKVVTGGGGTTPADSTVTTTAPLIAHWPQRDKECV